MNLRGMEEQAVSMEDFRAQVQDPSATSEADQHLYREGAKGDLRMGTNLEWVQASQGTPGTPRPGQRQHRHINRYVGVYIYIDVLYTLVNFSRGEARLRVLSRRRKEVATMARAPLRTKAWGSAHVGATLTRTHTYTHIYIYIW